MGRAQIYGKDLPDCKHNTHDYAFFAGHPERARLMRWPTCACERLQPDPEQPPAFDVVVIACERKTVKGVLVYTLSRMSVAGYGELKLGNIRSDDQIEAAYKLLAGKFDCCSLHGHV